MCGITGWVSYERDLTTQREVIDAMTATMADRGPDAAGTHLEPHAALGHRRLAVIDILGGTQPMIAHTPAGDVTLTYSGEVYNYPELREQLRHRGHAFSTSSDTEVVLRGYLEWGTAVVDHLNGMYAFAIWDARTETLLLARDRMGIKPLYYYPTPDGVLFGSEPKAILANPLADPVVDADGLRELFFGFNKTPGQAIWAGMPELPPATVATVDRSGIHLRRYWELTATPHTDDLDTTVRTIRGLLDDIVARQLVSDVPRCMLLSGGLDSSALTGLAAGHLRGLGERLRTFAVDFVDQAANFVADEGHPTTDAPFVHDVAAYVGSEHHDIVLDHTAVADPEIRRACVAARDLPVGLGDRDLSAYLLFRAIREHSTVAVSGESGDEVFGGYPSFHHPQAQRADTFPWLALAPVRPVNLLDGQFLRTIDHEGYLRDRYAQAVAAAPGLDGESEFERRMRVSCYLHLTHLLGVMLDRKDRISMAVGLEARVPLCDHRLVQYVFNTPWSMKTADGREKSLLRAATADVLPESVIGRKKSGYPATHDPRYLAALRREAADLLSAHHPVLEFYDREQVRAAVTAPPAEVTAGQRSGLERLLDLAIWMDIRRPAFKFSG
jgi:asparagine synthase (glutamine-hydrolysing)